MNASKNHFLNIFALRMIFVHGHIVLIFVFIDGAFLLIN